MILSSQIKNKKSFNNSKELRAPPIPLSGYDVINKLRDYEQIKFGKVDEDQAGKKRKRDECNLPKNWKKESIFFQLPYWKNLLLRHNLDVMHIEKNVCDNVIGALLNIEGKTKDNLKARFDMELMGIRDQLHPTQEGDKFLLPPACYTMSLAEKRKFCKCLKTIKIPDTYSSNISRCVEVKKCKISGLKSHDCHVLMQQFLPVAIRGLLTKDVCIVLIELCTFFRQLCSKVLKIGELEQLESRIALTLCKLERIFPPAFLDIMVHLPIHLTGEAKIGGPVQYRWMYPIERYLRRLKSYVRNKNYPEGSIAQGYLSEESLTFCSRYLHGVETRFNRPERNNDDGDVEPFGKLSIFIGAGRPIGKATRHILSINEREQAHLYVLNNCTEVAPFVQQYKQMIQETHNLSAREVERTYIKEFGGWFKHHVAKMRLDGEQVNEQLEVLALGPSQSVNHFKGYIVNGYRFHTADHERRRKTQCSGVFVVAETPSFASSRDKNPMIGNIGYYGVLNDVLEFRYPDGNHIVLFKCHWWNVNNHRGIKQDDYGFTCVNITRTLKSNDKFILATQAEQVFYVKDITDDNWLVVLKRQPRNVYDLQREEEPFQENEFQLEQDSANTIEINNDVIWSRDDIEGILVEGDG